MAKRGSKCGNEHFWPLNHCWGGEAKGSWGWCWGTSQPSHQGPAVGEGFSCPGGLSTEAGDEDALEAEDWQEEGKLRSCSA